VLNTESFPQVRRNPACGSCGGSGYVYLWSIPLDGPRVWFCDRSGCKRFWSDAAPASILELAHDAPADAARAPVLRMDVPALQPV
jgi:hypothetical protein